MKIELLRINSLRNLEQVEIRPGPGINFFFGRNGAGKTSLIEAIYLLGRGRTYRGASAGPLIKAGNDSLEVFARADKGEGERKSVGIWKNKKDTKIKIDGVYVRKLSTLARSVPLQIITTQSHDFLIRGPSIRRRFIDWGLFHVEPQYQQWFSRYRRNLDHRNALLKRGGGDTAVWDIQLTESGQKIHQFRERYLKDLFPVFREIAQAFFSELDFGVEYHRGWPTSEEYAHALGRNLSQDIRRGFTSVGVHKADLRLKAGTHSAERVLSRGQQKLLVVSLLLAQATLMDRKSGDAPIVLFDDISAELDKENLRVLLQLIQGTTYQIYTNSTEDVLGGDLGDLLQGVRMFHVEHGAISSIN